MRALFAALAGATIVVAASQASALDVGDKAPALDVKEWIEGDPAALDGKNVYVVEFWATWCPPCRQSIPHLSALADRFRGKGLEVVGISDESADTVREFAKGIKFTYHVAIDPDRKSYAAYMEGVSGIQHAFVVDKSGVVVWQGHPMDGMDAVVEQVLDGKYDVAKAKDAAAKASEKTKRVDPLVKELQASFRTNDLDHIAAAADKLLEADPSNEMGLDVKLKVFAQKNDAAGSRAFVEKLLAKVDGDAQTLNAVAWRLITADKLPMRQPAAALKAARRAVELTESKDPAILDMLARVYFEIGMLDQALDVEKKAAAAPGASDDIRATLAYYETCAQITKLAALPAAK